MVHMWRPGMSHDRAPERGVSGTERGNGVQDGEVWNEGMGYKTGRSDHATKHDTQ